MIICLMDGASGNRVGARELIIQDGAFEETWGRWGLKGSYGGTPQGVCRNYLERLPLLALARLAWLCPKNLRWVHADDP